jgi:hypothetical protein
MKRYRVGFSRTADAQVETTEYDHRATDQTDRTCDDQTAEGTLPQRRGRACRRTATILAVEPSELRS